MENHLRFEELFFWIKPGQAKKMMVFSQNSKDRGEGLKAPAQIDLYQIVQLQGLSM